MSLAVCEFDAPGGFVLCGEERRVVGEAVDTVVAGGFVAHVECFGASGCKGYILEGVVGPDGVLEAWAVHQVGPLGAAYQVLPLAVASRAGLPGAASPAIVVTRMDSSWA